MKIGPFNVSLAGRAAKRRDYTAARVSRLTSDWVYSHQSADKEIKGGLERIRDRARDLERNSDFARRYLALVESNIVGKAGFSLRFDVQPELAQTAAIVRNAFFDWLAKADLSGACDGPSLQRLIIRSTARDGEGLALFRRGGSNPDGIGLQVLESDFLPVQKDGYGIGGTMGIETDPTGRPVAYWLYDKHPAETMDGRAGANLVKHPAADVVHVYRPERPGQRRAVSWMTSAMLPLKMLSGYQEAELVAARVAACSMGFYKVPPGNDFGGDGTDDNGQPVTDASPGAFERLPAGWDFMQYDPKHPTTQYGEFVKNILREIAAGLGVSYSALANDGSDANYSSMREMSILERENWMVLQAWFARAFMSRIYREWLKSASDFGSLRGVNTEPFATTDRWTGKTWPWVDPEKDARARESDVAMRLTAPSILAAEKGLDYAEMCRIAAGDEAMREAEKRKAFDAAGLTQIPAEEEPK